MNEFQNIRGGAELNQFLSQLPVKVEKNILRGALRAGMKPVEAEVKANVPVKSGVLRGGIKLSTASRGGVVRARLRMTGKHAFIAKWLEYTGAAAHWIKAKSAKSLFIAGLMREIVNHPGFQAKPFLRPALERQAAPAVVAAASYVKTRLTKEGLEGVGEVEVGS